jgi:GLPGLI family protein
MKKVLLLMMMAGSYGLVSAQTKEGTIIYERKVNMHRTITDEQMRAMIPEFRTTKHMLLFSDSISLYKAVPEDEAPDPFGGGGGGVRMVFRSPGDAGELYKNLSQAKSIQASEVGGRNFLITDSIKIQPWKLGTETKIIMGHLCHKATRMVPVAVGRIRTVTMGGGNATPVDTTQQTKPREAEAVAWYAEDMISPTGPESYGQLPGVILQLDIDNGQTVYTATEIKKNADPKELKEPKKGKVITRAEYVKMMSEMMNNQIQGGGRSFSFGG